MLRKNFQLLLSNFLKMIEYFLSYIYPTPNQTNQSQTTGKNDSVPKEKNEKNEKNENNKTTQTATEKNDSVVPKEKNEKNENEMKITYVDGTPTNFHYTLCPVGNDFILEARLFNPCDTCKKKRIGIFCAINPR